MTVNYELGKPRKDGSRKVYILVTDKTRKRIATTMIVRKEDLTKSGNIKNASKMAEIQKFITDAIRKVDNEPLKVEKQEGRTKEVVRIISGEEGRDFLGWADSWISKCGLAGAKNYMCAINSFRKFVARDHLLFAEITPQLLTDYCESLAQKQRGQSQYLACIRHIWNEAERLLPDDEVPRSPFRKFRVPRQQFVGQRAVDVSIINKVYNYVATPGSRAELARNCYILSFCLIGTNSVDLYNCTCYEDGIIKYDRTKTKGRRADNAHIEIKVLPIIAHIIEKYRDKTGKRTFDFYTRYESSASFNKNINRGLKEIDDTLTFYTARHTWATIARNELHKSREDVDEALNHKSASTSLLDIYVKKDWRIINEINAEVVDFAFCKKTRNY